ncbi:MULTISPECIES: hypothetical protein [unclassified Spirillospora]|uniref:hypothetical protein n=1 Tax=unclassified Spirillospora TaxID=2642701 RepID=UPI003721E508
MPQEAAGTKRQAIGLDGRPERHRLQDVLAVASITIGLAALILGWIPATHFPGAVAGLIGLPLALYSQMISETTNERWLNVIGMVASFLGIGFALNNGGLTF